MVLMCHSIIVLVVLLCIVHRAVIVVPVFLVLVLTITCLYYPPTGQNDLKREEKHEKSVSDIVVSFFKAENMVFLSNREGINTTAMKP